MTDTITLPAPAADASKPKIAKKPKGTGVPRAKAAAPVAKTFSVADRARELKLDPKVARRRMRANVAKAKPAKTPDTLKSTSRKNARYEYARTEANLKLIDAIIRNPA